MLRLCRAGKRVLVGFIGMMILGVSSRVAPILAGVEKKRSLQRAHSFCVLYGPVDQTQISAWFVQ